MPRYTLNFVPEINSQWWQAGASWLGRDCHSMQSVTQAKIKGIAPEQMFQMTRKARRYGFQAQLKAAFSLAQNYQLDDLIQAINAFCIQQRILYIPMPQVQWLGSYLALQPHTECAAIDSLASRCLHHFHPLSAPISLSEQSKWQHHPLTLRQQQLHRQWGNPYTEEEFRFHLRLSDPIDLSSEAVRSRLRDAAVKHFQISQVMHISALGLFYETEPDAGFRLLRQFQFGRISTLSADEQRLISALNECDQMESVTEPANISAKEKFSDFFSAAYLPPDRHS